MNDSCGLNSSVCQNNGQCSINVSSNTTYCQCDECHYGIFCENEAWRQGKYDTTYAFLIVSIVGVSFSLLNNGLIFELYICCRRIRFKNDGTYLLVYSILSLLSNILLVTDQAVQYYSNSLTKDSNRYAVFHCFMTTIGYNTLLYLCIWFSSLITFERSLTIYFTGKMHPIRWLSYILITVMLVLAVGSVTPLLVYKCDWENRPTIQTLRTFFVWFYIIMGIVVYLVATVIVFISFALRIHHYGMDNGSCVKTFRKLLASHLFIFAPPVAYGIAQLPYTIAVNTKNPKHSFYQCGISLGEFIVKVIMESLTGVPYALTWLLFVYPSRVYMTEFYLNTWSGQRLANIIIHCRPCIDRAYNCFLSVINRRNHEHNNPQVRFENNEAERCYLISSTP